MYAASTLPGSFAFSSKEKTTSPAALPAEQNRKGLFRLVSGVSSEVNVLLPAARRYPRTV